jgi:hypothetical protein
VKIAAVGRTIRIVVQAREFLAHKLRVVDSLDIGGRLRAVLPRVGAASLHQPEEPANEDVFGERATKRRSRALCPSVATEINEVAYRSARVIDLGVE